MSRKSEDRGSSEERYEDRPLNPCPKKYFHPEPGKLKAVIMCIDPNVHSERAFQYFMEHLYRPDHLIVLVHSAEHPKASLGKTSKQYIARLREIRAKELADLKGVTYEPGAGTDEEITKKESDLRTLEDFFVHYMDKRKIQYKSRFVWHNGKAGQAIVHIAEEERAILIVTGSRGLGKIRRTILGSTSDYVMHHTNIPVMICPKKHDDVE
ncbi:uncharacterized protein LOC135501784 isoform X1 [Lineus longissimus]|uniref:uncharacterized protein LOC135501784 isoform X1 n=1 Tax=Lineus longissimus TaxID=88925 RepID=UPI002B4FB5B5